MPPKRPPVSRSSMASAQLILRGSLIAPTIVGVPSNAGAAHPLTDFSVFGYHLTGSTGT